MLLAAQAGLRLHSPLLLSRLAPALAALAPGLPGAALAHIARSCLRLRRPAVRPVVEALVAGGACAQRLAALQPRHAIVLMSVAAFYRCAGGGRLGGQALWGRALPWGNAPAARAKW